MKRQIIKVEYLRSFENKLVAVEYYSDGSGRLVKLEGKSIIDYILQDEPEDVS